ncbi:Cdc6/Cdc18 family protein [Halococcus thailandensis]|uniref:ORC1-type DNA replication protein n=1 Tax=Halococcus thailandensis JCM 13552 TaxID=1227457 RepID=M0NFN8_9EURY|nr:orc1/cdc6 family replication initiation protein [Halococcus thailandensis]EMA56368.1 orc1/cdc6 family replication initiation protein [Halococcus thailandensis JCM 13552]
MVDADDIFGGGEIFRRRELLRVGHVPELDRVVGRDDEITEMGRALGPGTRGGPPDSIVIYGKTGTGKSLVSRCTTREAQRQAQENGATLQYGYVDCSDYTTETQASRELAQQLAENIDTDHNIPRKGVGAATYRDMTWEMLNKHNVDSFVAILDEIDKLEDDELLRSLSRAKESGKASCHIGVICISNKVEYKERLDQRVHSSLQDNELIFNPYDPDQLRSILNNRREAFQEGVLEDGVVPKTAALAGREHGDARKAVDMLYEAGRLAEKDGLTTVSESHIDAALTKAEVNRVKQLISGSPPHVKYILQALALLTKSRNTSTFRTSEIYEFYQRLVDREGMDSISQDRVYRLLKEQAFLGLLEANHTGGGDYEGAYLEHTLISEPEVVLNALDNSPLDTPRNE